MSMHESVPKDNMVCENCGMQIPARGAYCPHCGINREFEKDSPSSAVMENQWFTPAGDLDGKSGKENTGVCVWCGKKLRSGAKFCPACGKPCDGGGKSGGPNKEDSPEKNTSYCAGCGKELRSGAKFCPACGKPCGAGRGRRIIKD